MKKSRQFLSIRRTLAVVVLPFALLTSGAPAAFAVSSTDNSIVVADGGRFDHQEDSWKYSGRDKKCKAKTSEESKSEKTDSSSDDAPPSTSGYDPVTGDLFVEGSDTYKSAQNIYKIFTEEYGVSGAFAAGVIANSYFESGLIPDRGEGGGNVRFGMNGSSAPAGLSGGQGGGLFQFTPYTKYTTSDFWKKDGKDGWEPLNQVAYLWNAEFSNGSVMMYVASTNPGYGAASYGRTPQFTELMDWLTTDDPRKSAEAWMVGYERPGEFQQARLDIASHVNSVFNKDNKKADEAKIKSRLGGSSPSGSSDDLSSETSKSAQDDEKSKDDCVGTEEGSGESETSGSAEDWTGDHGFGDNVTRWQYGWSYDELPDNLKQYAIQPSDLGLKYGDCSNWTPVTGTSGPSLNGQCVALTKIFTNKYWQKDGHAPGGFACNGNACAQAAADANGGKYTSKPSKGAVVSVDSAGSPYGHTYVVSHVFKNGDLLAIEQNTPLSGWDMHGGACQWNWRIVPKSEYTSENGRFYSPADQGYKPVVGSKSGSDNKSDDSGKSDK